jgi:hypothetical protein
MKEVKKKTMSTQGQDGRVPRRGKNKYEGSEAETHLEDSRTRRRSPL